MVCKGFFVLLDKFQGVCGQDEFVWVSWEQVLDLIDVQYWWICDSYGLVFIFVGFYGWCFNGVLYKVVMLLQCYMSLVGGYIGYFGDYFIGVVQVIMFYVVGGNEVYQQQISWLLVFEYSEVVVLWSVNLLNMLKIVWNVFDE